MALSTYSDLVQAVKDWAENTESDFTAQIPDFIHLCEQDLRRLLRTRGMQTRAEAAGTVSSRYLSLPAGFLAMRALWIEMTPIQKLDQLGIDDLLEHFTYTQANGKPQNFAVHEELQFNRPLDSAYTFSMIYWRKWDQLSSSNATNTIMDNHPDIYLAGTLNYAWKYLQDAENQAEWKNEFFELIAKANAEVKKDQWSQARLKRRPKMKVVY